MKVARRDGPSKVVCSLCGSADCFVEFRKTAYSFYRCSSCSHVFVFPLPSADESARFYGSAYQPDYVDQIGEWFKVLAQRRMELLQRCYPDGETASLLDIGAGYGFFLAEAAKRGWRVTGIEPSEVCRQFALKEFDLVSVGGDTMEVLHELSNGGFDVVTLWHVAEHLEDISRVLEQALRVLRENGLLVINSPNLDSAIYRLVGKHWSWIYVPGHLQYFTVSSAVKWARRHNLKIDIKETWTHAPNLFFLIEEAYLLRLARLLRRIPRTSSVGARLEGFVYRPFHQQCVQLALRHAYDLISPLDRFLKAHDLGHEFILVAQKREDTGS